MYIGRIVGTVTSTIKHKLYNGHKLMLVARLNLDGSESSSYDIVLDDVHAGVGDVVVVIDEGVQVETPPLKGTCASARTE